jgi:tetratricopeptide (TPR) repeat protein
MATKMYEATFASVLPQQRLRSSILADLNYLNPGKATDASIAQIAKIELHIKNASDLFRTNQYNGALDEYKQARASIYKILYPGFDVKATLGRKDILLPISAVLEQELINSSIRIGEIIKPLEALDNSIYTKVDNGMPDHLKSFTETGFKEANHIAEMVENASAQGVALMQDDKPEAAINMMEDVLKQTSLQNEVLEPTLAGALQLNLAAAYIQVSNMEKASSFANESLKSFETGKDSVGQAQALHMMGVSASKTGDAAKSKEFLDKASSLLEVKQPLLQDVAPVSRKSGLQPFSRKLEFPSSRLMSGKLEDLQPISKKDITNLTYRVPGNRTNWGNIEIANGNINAREWNVGIFSGGELIRIPVGKEVVTREKVVSSIYDQRISKERFDEIELKIVGTSSITYYLTHLYAYVLPVKIGDCFYALGKYKSAEENYMQASQYTYLNKNIEATSLWIKIALNSLQWGNSLYKEEKLPEAKVQYSKLINDDGTVPASILYDTLSLKIPADDARALITNILTRPLPQINWEISYYILTASGHLQKILEGLDWPFHPFILLNIYKVLPVDLLKKPSRQNGSL